MTAPKTDEAGITQTIRALTAAGWKLSHVDDREEITKVADGKSAVKAITAVDEAFLYVTLGDESGYVFFVLGNDPDEVICDYTLNLDTVIDPLQRSWW